MATIDAFYEPGDGETYLATEHTQGPWDSRFQHGGPPAALLTRAIERLLSREGAGLVVARLTFDILRPIPRLPLSATARMDRYGRRIQLVRATLSDGAEPLVTASAWAVAPAPDHFPPTEQAVPAPPSPIGLAERDPTDHPEWRCGFLAATEWRFVRGDYGTPGPATVWMRPRVPLLPDEVPSPIQRVALTVDSANGVSAVREITDWSFIPPELTVHVVRAPRGEWLCLDASSFVQPGAVGLAGADLYDGDGLVARSAQAILVAARTPGGAR